MSQVLKEALQANEHSYRSLAIDAVSLCSLRLITVLTCMDARF